MVNYSWHSYQGFWYDIVLIDSMLLLLLLLLVVVVVVVVVVVLLVVLALVRIFPSYATRPSAIASQMWFVSPPPQLMST